MKGGEVVKKIEFGIEEFILFAIIILNILDALEIIGSDLDYVKKIISWTALGILVYKVSPSKIFVGFRKKNMDIILISGYFAMILKNLISYAQVALKNSSTFLEPLYSFLIEYSTTIEITGIYIGLFLIIFVCFNLSLRTPLLAPSILHLMRADKVKHDAKTFFLHFFSLLFIALSFFLIFFDLIMEWLAIAIDAPLLMIGLVSYFFIIIKHKKHLSPNSFLSKFGDFGSDFYKGIMEHLRYKRAFLRVISGMLILHILTDMLTFIWYYVFGIVDQLYFGFIGPHETIYRLIEVDLATSWLTSIIHVGNLIGLLFLMITPILIWFILYFNKKIKPNNQLLTLIGFGLITLLLNPAFNITVLKKSIYGVDIMGVSATANQILPFSWTIIIALLITIIFSFIHAKSLQTILLIASEIFFVMYVSLFAFSISLYYLNIIPLLFSSNIFISIIFSIFFIITAGFYIVGMGSFLVDVYEHFDSHVST